MELVRRKKDKEKDEQVEFLLEKMIMEKKDLEEKYLREVDELREINFREKNEWEKEILNFKEKTEKMEKMMIEGGNKENYCSVNAGGDCFKSIQYDDDLTSEFPNFGNVRIVLAEKEEREKTLNQKIELLVKANEDLMHRLANTREGNNEYSDVLKENKILDEENRRLNSIIDTIKSSLGR